MKEEKQEDQLGDCCNNSGGDEGILAAVEIEING